MAAEDPRQRPLVLRLELVVELLVDAVADLLADRLRVHPRGDPLDEPQDQPQVLHVGADRGGDARVLDLDRHAAAVVERRAVDLADRGGGDRLLVEVVEHVLERLVELLLDHLAHVLEVDRRGGVSERRELALELLPVLLGHYPDVQERHHLPDLHRGALHRPERGDDLLGGLDVAALRARPARPSFARVTLAARVPAWRIAWPAASPPIFAVRRTREVGMLSLATAVMLSGRGA